MNILLYFFQTDLSKNVYFHDFYDSFNTLFTYFHDKFICFNIKCVYFNDAAYVIFELFV